MQFALLKRALDECGVKYVNLQYIFPTEAVDEIDWSALANEGNEFALFKSHDVKILELLPSGFEVAPIFIYRDLRDTYLSMKEKFGCGTEKIPQIVENFTFAASYVSRLQEKLIQNYEHFYLNKEESISEMLKYTKISLPMAKVRELAVDEVKVPAWKTFVFGLLKRVVALRRLSRTPMTSLEKRIGRWIYGPILSSMTDPDTQVHPDHFSKRKGAPGGWIEALSEEEKRKFEELGVGGPDYLSSLMREPVGDHD